MLLMKAGAERVTIRKPFGQVLFAGTPFQLFRLRKNTLLSPSPRLHRFTVPQFTSRRAFGTNVAMAQIPSLTLNDGNSIPMLAYGTGTAWYKSSQTGINRDLIDLIKKAIELGYRHLDCAEVYGTESELGMAIKESNVPREQLFVTTKVHRGIQNIPEAFEASLQNLQLDYVDLYLIHQPFFAASDKDLQDAWVAMESIKKSGRAKSIGVSNYLTNHILATLKTATVPPAVNQIEYHPYLQHLDLPAFHKDHGITLEAYAPLAAITRAKPGPVDKIYARLSKKYNTTEGGIALRWCIDQGIVAVTTTTKESRLKANLEINDFKLSAEDIEEIAEAGRKKHFRLFWTDKFDPDDRS